MSNETGAKSLNDIISDKEFCIPMYQRNYKWNSDVAEKLVEDIISSYEMKNDTKKSLGLITLFYDETNKKYDVIDGQQRFTTLAILLNLLKSKKTIALTFERDVEDDKKRSKAINGELGKDVECTDVNRINRNRNKMDGVLNNDSSMLFYKCIFDEKIGVDRRSLDILKHICDIYNAKIVLSSSYRLGFDSNMNPKSNSAVLELNKLFMDNNIKVIGKTDNKSLPNEK